VALQRKGIRIAMVTGKGKHSTRNLVTVFFLDWKKISLRSLRQVQSGRNQRTFQLVSILTGIKIVHARQASTSDIIAGEMQASELLLTAPNTAEPGKKLMALSPDELFFYTIEDFTEWLYSEYKQARLICTKL
jgi:hypothetical protein